jgi:hypothetical protein
MLLDGSKACIANGKTTTLDKLTTEELELLVAPLINNHEPARIKFLDSEHPDTDEFYVTKIEYGQVAGFRIVDLIYPGDLIANVGESITSVLDKIRTMLTEFEYFYNLDGQFVF